MMVRRQNWLAHVVLMGLGLWGLGCSDTPAAETDGGLLDASQPIDAVAVDADMADACSECRPLPVFVGAWGGRGTEPGQFIEPSSVELDSQGVVIVAGHENRVQRFTPDGVLIDIFGMAGAGDAQFNHPHGLAVDRDRGDLLYVGDQENNRLQVFSKNKKLQEFQFERQWGDAKFKHIHDVGIDRASGEIFVGDYEGDTLRKFSATGDLVAEFGGTGTGPGQFNGVWGVSTDSQGFVYVADTFNRRVQKLTRDGAFVAEWTNYQGTNFTKPTGVYVDERDVVYVCDSLAQVIVLFDPEGTVLSIWNIEQIYGERSEPEDMVIDSAGKHVYIAEVLGHRVLHLMF